MILKKHSSILNDLSLVKSLLFMGLLSHFMVSCVVSKSSNRSTFSHEQKELITSASGQTPMRVFKINNYADSILLRTPASKLKRIATDSTLKTLTERMYATVTDKKSMGVGIAAPQVGILKNIILVQRLDKENTPFEVYINPKIIKYSTEKQDCPEGCLSIPNFRATTTDRAESIKIKYQKMDKTKIKERVSGFTAVIFQHEIDHLNGILFTDHLLKENKDAQARK